jgi:hypothetical protein
MDLIHLVKTQNSNVRSSVSIQGEEYSDHLSDYEILEMGCDSWIS